jgi:hypothetical protein
MCRVAQGGDAETSGVSGTSPCSTVCFLEEQHIVVQSPEGPACPINDMFLLLGLEVNSPPQEKRYCLMAALMLD